MGLSTPLKGQFWGLSGPLGICCSVCNKRNHSNVNNGMTAQLLQPSAILPTGQCVTLSWVKIFLVDAELAKNSHNGAGRASTSYSLNMVVDYIAPGWVLPCYTVNHTFKFHPIFCTCYKCQWLISLTAMRQVMYFQFRGYRHVFT